MIAERGRSLYPGWLRLWHWTNAGLFLVLAATGFSMHFASPGVPLIPFAAARVAHNAAGMAVAAAWGFFLAANARSGNWRHYRLKWSGLVRGMVRQACWYLAGIFRGERNPHGESASTKFNPLQRVTYLGIMYAWFPLIAVTGLFLLFPAAAPDRILGMGGIWPMAVVHVLAAFAGALFVVGHVYLGTTGNPPLIYYRFMIMGDSPSRRSAR